MKARYAPLIRIRSNAARFPETAKRSHTMKNTSPVVETTKAFPYREDGCEHSTTLVSQTRVRDHGRNWHLAVLDEIKTRLGDDPDFPCLFSKNAFRKNLLKFIFIDDIEANGIRSLAEGLVQYIDLSRHWSGDLNTAYPLVVAFSLDVISAGSVERYHALGWNILQRLHMVDPAPWPDGVGVDPNLPSWSMCFNGMPLFCNMSLPAHRVRRSRNLGKHFLFIINPRERFDVVAGDNASGRKIRANIRKRIARYDDAPHCLQLGSYGAGGLEWWQYGITEESLERTDRCPFRFTKS
jgi:FPC/CPF motif-containing protein YcgG